VSRAAANSASISTGVFSRHSTFNGCGMVKITCQCAHSINRARVRCSQRSRATLLHCGQARCRHELYHTCSTCPLGQRCTCPPRAAVRHLRSAQAARYCGALSARLPASASK
jgi:hypothetical protein